MAQMTLINDNLSRVKGAYAALNMQGGLASLRAGIEATRLNVVNYRLKINSLKTEINTHRVMYNSLSSLSCRVPSQVP